MLSFIKRIFFSKDSIAERELNTEHDMNYGRSLAFRFRVTDYHETNDWVPDHCRTWMNDCINAVIIDVLAFVLSDDTFYNKTGVALHNGGVILLIASRRPTSLVTIRNSIMYFTTLLNSCVTQSVIKHTERMKNLFPGTDQEYHQMFKSGALRVTSRFFYLDERDPIQDALDYIQLQQNEPDIDLYEDDQQSFASYLWMLLFESNHIDENSEQDEQNQENEQIYANDGTDSSIYTVIKIDDNGKYVVFETNQISKIASAKWCKELETIEPTDDDHINVVLIESASNLRAKTEKAHRKRYQKIMPETDFAEVDRIRGEEKISWIALAEHFDKQPFTSSTSFVNIIEAFVQ